MTGRIASLAVSATHTFSKTPQERVRLVTEDGSAIWRGGVMAIVRTGGEVVQGAEIHVTFPGEPHRPLEKV